MEVIREHTGLEDVETVEACFDRRSVIPNRVVFLVSQILAVLLALLLLDLNLGCLLLGLLFVEPFRGVGDMGGGVMSARSAAGLLLLAWLGLFIVAK